MGLRGLLIAEAGVAFRAMILALVGYGVYIVFTGASFDILVAASIAGALFVVANALFFAMKLLRGDLLAVAASIEDRL